MRPTAGQERSDDFFVATVRDRLQHEFLEPEQSDLRLSIFVDSVAPNPCLVAIGASRTATAAERYVGVFSIDRETFDAALAAGQDPIDAGALVYLRREHARALVDELTRTFRLRPTKPPSRPRKRS